ncbi:MAG: translocation/assembly module TamB domain-containing protein [Candidatus Dependentiae bacterium]|nr:translocation/assembly module TamB domain-containing protein [Candidatus Dependentiae bacterium]
MKKLLYRFLLFFSKVLLGCLLGSIILLFYASRSEVVRQEIKKSVQKTFKEGFDCDWDGEIASIDLLALNIQFNNVSILPCNRDDGWSLYSHKFHVSASLLEFLIYRRFSCHAYFEQGIVYEKQTSDQSHFMQVLSKMFAEGLPSNISFDYITIKQGQVVLEDASGDGRLSYHYHCQMSRERDGLHTKLYVEDGNVRYKDIVIFENLFGNFVSIAPYNNDLQEIYARIDCRLSIPALQEKGACFLVGDLYRSRGAFVISNEDQSFIIEPLKIKLKQHAIPFTCSVTMESEIIQRLIFQQIIDPELTGNVTVTMMGNLLNLHSSLQGALQVQKLSYKNNSLIDRASINFKKENDGYVTKLFMNNRLEFQGTCTNIDDNFAFDISNVAELQPWGVRYWTILVGQGSMTGEIRPSLYELEGKYHLQLHSAKLDAQAKIEGICKINPNEFSCSGLCLDKQYECVIALLPVPHLIKFRYFSEDEILIDLHEHADPLQGTIGFVSFNFIKNLLPDIYKSSFSQPGKFEMQGNLQNGGYYAQVSTENAHIRIPSLYNVIQNFKATTTFDFIGRSIIFDQVVADLYEGTVRCDHAIATFDNKAQSSFLHIPLFLDNMLMSWNKGIFGIVSGRLFLSQQNQKIPELQGNLIVDKAQLKGNIFSKEFQEQLVGVVGSSQGVDLNAHLNITVETKEPVTVETSFLQAMVHLDLHIGNTVKQPEIEGTIDIASGELKFPYKSLFITHGQILIMPKNSTEPTIEFVAKGKIKRYEITMRATGTVIDQQIHFESSPYLTEEQIISLLLVGSQDSSLTVVMPAMFMQKLHEIVFGPAISKSKLDVMFNRLLQFFKNVRIFPQFTNQTGRGGVRGIIEVDATDRLHGRIDTNLMQLEDIIFEADYMLTDDVMVRAIKDGPSTYGGEVEMRWKFS